MKKVIYGASFFLLLFTLGAGKATRKASAREGGAKVVRLSVGDVATIHVHLGGSVLSFAAKPSKVIIGREGQFDVQYVENDVAIVSLSSAARANMYVYVLGRRYSFNLVTASGGGGDRIILVRDPSEERVKVDVK